MATTSIIVELLIVGFFTLAWMLLLCIRISLVDVDTVRRLLPFLQSTLGLLLVSGSSYYFGVVTNAIINRLTEPLGQSRYRERMVPGTTYDAITTKVRQHASEEVNRTLLLYLSAVRLTRAGVINFGLMALILFTFPWRIAVFGFVALFFSMLSLNGWFETNRSYYRRIAYGYKEITGQTINESLFKRHSLIQRVRNLFSPAKAPS